MSGNTLPDLVCFSHLRWHFVYQRPQHLMSRFAQVGRVFFIEEPVSAAGGRDELEISEPQPNLHLVVPRLVGELQGSGAEARQRAMITDFLLGQGVVEPALWFWTPMSLPLAADLQASLIIYDCMDELSAFMGAPPELLVREEQLLQAADIVFTGGYSLYEGKRDRHDNVHPFPSCVDIEHFGAARRQPPDPPDQAELGRPRLGFFGVVDERLDLALLDNLAASRPDWQIVIVGPVVKIDPATLPRRPNLHYLGQKSYGELPAYLGGWDVALMPFAMNEATRFISPTKTPEFLAGGLPVVATPIRDVVRTYGEHPMVAIAQDPLGFISATDRFLMRGLDASARAANDVLLRSMTWDASWQRMKDLMQCARRGTASAMQPTGPLSSARSASRHVA